MNSFVYFECALPLPLVCHDRTPRLRYSHIHSRLYVFHAQSSCARSTSPSSSPSPDTYTLLSPPTRAQYSQLFSRLYTHLYVQLCVSLCTHHGISRLRFGVRAAGGTWMGERIRRGRPKGVYALSATPSKGAGFSYLQTHSKSGNRHRVELAPPVDRRLREHLFRPRRFHSSLSARNANGLCK